ncbi:MAG: hypothetical protein KF830_18485 [Planctomycetes bacterium]|nr:hypothetical protein [Planctomycetota bacterium]
MPAIVLALVCLAASSSPLLAQDPRASARPSRRPVADLEQQLLRAIEVLEREDLGPAERDRLRTDLRALVERVRQQPPPAPPSPTVWRVVADDDPGDEAVVVEMALEAEGQQNPGQARPGATVRIVETSPAAVAAPRARVVRVPAPPPPVRPAAPPLATAPTAPEAVAEREYRVARAAKAAADGAAAATPARVRAEQVAHERRIDAMRRAERKHAGAAAERPVEPVPAEGPGDAEAAEVRTMVEELRQEMREIRELMERLRERTPGRG